MKRVDLGTIVQFLDAQANECVGVYDYWDATREKHVVIVSNMRDETLKVPNPVLVSDYDLIGPYDVATHHQ